MFRLIPTVNQCDTDQKSQQHKSMACLGSNLFEHKSLFRIKKKLAFGKMKARTKCKFIHYGFAKGIYVFEKYEKVLIIDNKR